MKPRIHVHWRILAAIAAFVQVGFVQVKPSRADNIGAEQANAPQSIEAASPTPGITVLYWSAPATPGVASYQIIRNNVVVAARGADDRYYRDRVVLGQVNRYRVDAIYPDGTAGASHTIAEKSTGLMTSVQRYDVVVVSASSAGVAAAVTAARHGLRVALLEPTDRLGGIMSSGLCSTDIRKPEHITGFFEEFRARVQQYYGSGTGLHYEPHVVNNVLKEMVADEPQIDLFYHVRPIQVRVEGCRVIGVRVESVDTRARAWFYAPMTIDADPTGDVMAWAGCGWRVGREKRSKSEPHAGVIYYSRAADKLLPGSTGAADGRIMSYAYLAVVKDYGPKTDHRIPKPAGYQESDFIHGPAWKDSWAVTSGFMPASKYELNQHPQGNDLQEINYRWASQNYLQRSAIETAYRNHVLGYIYYLQNHDNVHGLGLPDDEFPENGGFPETLYVRESRRVEGLACLNEADVTLAAERLRPDSGGIGDYPMDSHAVRPKTNWNTPDMGEGEYWLYRTTPWYQVPVGIVIPKYREGVLVAEAVSATHVGFDTLRMEPVRMQTGSLCGLIAAISAETGLQPWEIPASMVQDFLMSEGQRCYWHSDVAAGAPYAPAVEYLSSRGFFQDAAFRPQAEVTRGEASKWLSRFEWLEAAQSGEQGLAAKVHGSATRSPAHPDELLTRGDFALWLTSIERRLGGPWNLSEGHGQNPYVDVEPGSAVGEAATQLAQHHIDSSLWSGSAPSRDGRLVFGFERPILRADLAETLFLAQRYFASPLFNEVLTISMDGPPAPR